MAKYRNGDTICCRVSASGDNNHPQLGLEVEGPLADNSRDSSNRNYVINVIVLYINIVVNRYQTSPGADHVDLALFCWRLYTRYLRKGVGMIMIIIIPGLYTFLLSLQCIYS